MALPTQLPSESNTEDSEYKSILYHYCTTNRQFKGNRVDSQMLYRRMKIFVHLNMFVVAFLSCGSRSGSRSTSSRSPTTPIFSSPFKSKSWQTTKHTHTFAGELHFQIICHGCRGGDTVLLKSFCLVTIKLTNHFAIITKNIILWLYMIHKRSPTLLTLCLSVHYTWGGCPLEDIFIMMV